MATDPYPEDVLLRFVERLPTTIRDVILARFCMAFGRLQPTDNQDLSATFRSILMTPAGEARAYACAQAVAVLELVLHEGSACSQEALARELAGTAGSRRFEGIVLDAPLAQRHWHNAREELLALRATSLGIDALCRLLANRLDASEHRSSRHDRV
ncbi:MAG: hypothetical protein JXB36_14345 [Gammaproteobacteria bacterium]|nr:hypothetical protein [Gammaproteobacteria bacterium]